MSRDRANIRIDIWGDDDWRKLSAGAQHLYLTLLTHPTLSYCGVADWRPGRLAALASGSTRDQIIERAEELSEALFIVVDIDTEEVLVRSFIKHDGLMRQPKLAVSMANAFAGTASEKLRNVIAFEVQKYQLAFPKLSCWEDSRVQTVLSAEAKPASEFTPTVTPGFTPTVTPGAGQELVVGLPLPTTTATTTSPKGDTSEKSDDTKPPEDVARLCGLLASLIRGNGNRVGTVGKRWWDACDRMIRRDNRDPSEIEQVIRWCQNDEFWIGNILSMPKLREKYDTLRSQMVRRAKPAVYDPLNDQTPRPRPLWQTEIGADNG